MLLSYCSECNHLETVEIKEESHSKCRKENCLAIYTKCISEEAIKQFVSNDQLGSNKWTTSALEICYPAD